LFSDLRIGHFAKARSTVAIHLFKLLGIGKLLGYKRKTKKGSLIISTLQVYTRR
jgi:uncharacterized membrane protein (UPF0136 family)